VALSPDYLVLLSPVVVVVVPAVFRMSGLADMRVLQVVAPVVPVVSPAAQPCC
jgi:hypothetical protein